MFKRRYTQEEKEHLVELALKLGSSRKAAKESGVSNTSISVFMREVGKNFPSTKETAIKRNDFVEHNGITFFWSKAHSYRGSKDGVKCYLSDILYREKFGCERPKGMIIKYIDGNRKNISLENIRFITNSQQATEMYEQDTEQRKRWLKMGSEKQKAIEKEKPWLASRRAKRAWTTRLEKDPENDWANKMRESKAKNFRETGSHYKNEALAKKHMSDAHKGLTREKIALNKAMADRRAIAKKLGIRM